MSLDLTGCFTALVTPFTKDGAVDEKALRAFVAWQLEQGVHGLVPVGSTGEAATMDVEERARVVAITAEVAAGRVAVVAGAGGNDTRACIAWSKRMVESGATHLLHVSPAYSKPPQRGLIAHYRAIADAAKKPVMLYNVPGRTASNLEAETTLALAEHDNIVAVKEASGNLQQIGEIIRRRPEGFRVLSGDDGLTLAVMALGGEGIVSVVSNAVPRAMSQLTEACARGDWAAARSIHRRLEPFMKAAFVESNPIPVKAAVSMLGRCANVLRLPLVSLDPRHEPLLRESLTAAGAGLK